MPANLSIAMDMASPITKVKQIKAEIENLLSPKDLGSTKIQHTGSSRPLTSQAVNPGIFRSRNRNFSAAL